MVKFSKNLRLPVTTATFFGLAALTGLVWLAIWALFGMFDDAFVLFRFTNYFGSYVPLLAVVGVCLSLSLLRSTAWRILSLIITLPSVLLPLVLPSMVSNGPLDVRVTEGQPMLELDVVTYSRTGHNKEYERIAELVDCQKYGLILLQEFGDIEEFEALYSDQLAGCFVSFPQSKYSFKSVGIVSAYEITNARVTDAGVRASIQVGGQNVELLTSRFSRSITQSGFREQQRQIDLAIEELAGAPIAILAGDFNSTQYNESLYRLRRHFVLADPGGMLNSSATFPAEKRWYAFLGALVGIDHIFYRGMNLLSSDVVDDSYGSDHFPVHARFSLPLMENPDE